VAAVTMAEDIVIRTIKIAVAATIAAVSILAVRSVFIVAVRTQEAALLPEVALLPEAEAHMSPTAAVHAVGNR
jgi:hypothetical protein